MRNLHCEQESLHFIYTVDLAGAETFRPGYFISAVEGAALGFWLVETARYLPAINNEHPLNKSIITHTALLCNTPTMHRRLPPWIILRCRPRVRYHLDKLRHGRV